MCMIKVCYLCILKQRKNLTEKNMTTTRQNKVSRLIQKELGDIFQKQGNNLYHGAMITVTVVRITADLSQAKVYLSLFPPAKKDEIFTAVNEKNKAVRHELAKRVKNQLRIIPELKFFIDDSLDYMEKIDTLLKT